MPEAVDLSQLRDQAAQEDAVEDLERDDIIDVRTAFLVFVDKDGQTIMTHDVNLPVRPEHTPTPDEVYAACSVVAKDITVQETTARTVQGMVQMAQMQMQAAQQAQMQQQLLNNPNFRNGG